MSIRLNMGRTDRIVRVLVSIAIVAVVAAGLLPPTWGVVAMVVGLILFLTAVAGYCPLYSLLGISTLHSAEPQRPSRAM